MITNPHIKVKEVQTKMKENFQAWPVGIDVAGDDMLLAARRTYYYSYSGKSQLHYDISRSIITTM